MSTIITEATPEETITRLHAGQAPLRIHAGDTLSMPAAAPADDEQAAEDAAPADTAPAPVQQAAGLISNAAYFASIREFLDAFPWDNEKICIKIMNGFLRYTLAGMAPKAIPFLHLHITGAGEKERGDLYSFITGLFSEVEIAALPAGANVEAVNAALEAAPQARLLVLGDAEPILPALPYLVKRHGVPAVLSFHQKTAVDDLKELVDNEVEIHLRPYLDESERALMQSSIKAAELNTARAEALQAIKDETAKPITARTAAEKRAAQESLLERIAEMAKQARAISEGKPAPGLAQYAARVVKQYFSDNKEKMTDYLNPYFQTTYTIQPEKVLPLLYAAGDTPERLSGAIPEYARYMRAGEIEAGIRTNR